MSPIVDALERSAALDPAHSYIVQAPAGAGKTGLLTQRVLRLLATVERPEEILAITFTRKAAAEMRRRVLQALERARDPAPPADPNERLTWELAKEALARDGERGWQLAHNSVRLRIQTIDSLSASLSRQMPVLSGIGAPPAIVERAHDLYREAAERTLALIESADPVAAPVRRLLKHLDGDWSAARGLLETMLARRDQWIRRVAGFKADDQARSALEQAFGRERARVMGHARAMFSAAHASELAQLARFAAGNLSSAGVDSPIARLDALVGFPPTDEDGADAWCALAELLLTADGEWRSQFNKNQGFPPDKGAGAVFKPRMDTLLQAMRRIEGLCEALHAVRRMPPRAFTEEQWQVLGAMVAILPRAAGELHLVFAERGEIDFTGLAQGAVSALGEEDAPTDLLLALDVRLRHLLVDEFQDTSLGQWELLTRLTAGWSQDDGRTVFLVGDPMQSIYRFRDADVALFLQARARGLPSVALASVLLATNFRSQAGIVDWVNETFVRVLSESEDADAGAVPYARSSAHHAAVQGASAAQWHAFTGNDPEAAREAEAQTIVRLATAALREDPEGTVAILVRYRAHLARIVPALKAARIRFRAVDIEPLGRRPVIQDLLAIARALSHLADRVAWLSMLRAPWSGLTATDLHLLIDAPVASEGARLTVWELLNDEPHLVRLSGEGSVRARRLRDVFAPFVAGRLRGSLRERVEGAWLSLGGPACVERTSDLEDAETFFDQLDGLDQAGELADPTVLEDHLAELYAAPDVGDEARVQLMTIHKAKGLEFDTVIVPGLERIQRPADRPLFAWKARADGTLMMAPIRAAGEAKEPAYDYLRALDNMAADHEVERLLYVAATRAKKHLHLLGFARIDRAKGTVRPPSPKSLLGKAWKVAAAHFERATPMGDAPPDERAKPNDELRQLELSILEDAVAAWAAPPVAAPSEEPPSIEFSWAGETARHVGTIAHRWLQRIGMDGIEQWDLRRIGGLMPAIQRELARRGVPPKERESAAERVAGALEGAVGDPRGRWILASRPDSKFEYRLRVATPEGVRLLVIDRMFSDADGRRWIVDYKTSSHEGAGLEAFLDRELDRYGEQLRGYAAAFAGTAVEVGLYFPVVKGWRQGRLP